MVSVCLKVDNYLCRLNFRYKAENVPDSRSKIQAKEKERSGLIRSCYNCIWEVTSSILEPSYDTLLFES